MTDDCSIPLCITTHTRTTGMSECGMTCEGPQILIPQRTFLIVFQSHELA